MLYLLLTLKKYSGLEGVCRRKDIRRPVVRSFYLCPHRKVQTHWTRLNASKCASLVCAGCAHACAGCAQQTQTRAADWRLMPR